LAAYDDGFVLRGVTFDINCKINLSLRANKREKKMDQHLRQSIQSTTFFYFLIVVAITTFSQIATMMVICFADISGKENVVAASVLFPTLIGAFGIIRIMTNMQHIIADMDDAMKSTNFGTTVQATPISVLKLIFAAFFIIVALVQLSAIY
jgi:hypothetical protein